MQLIQFNNEKNYQNDFLKLPLKIYGKEYSEDKKEVIQILNGNHYLSKYFTVYKFLCYDENQVVGRFIITLYPNDNNAYIGYFECINDLNIAKALFDEASKFAKKKKCKKIVGPLNASFWLTYRLKINKFDEKPYTGEPYNKDYYLKLFFENQYKICEHYTSNIYQPVEYDYINKKYESRYQEFLGKGYQIVSPDLKQFDKLIKDIYRLLTELYKDFPLFKMIEEKDFIAIFKDFKKVMDPKMVKVAYYQKEMVGFFISIPNYHTLTSNLTVINLIKILNIKKNPKEYVMLYMGVDSNHHGLGKALAYSIMEELRDSGLTSIGALARDGKVTQNYVSDLCIDKYEYVLLERVVK